MSTFTELYQNPIDNKYYLLNNINNKKECNVYGQDLPKFDFLKSKEIKLNSIFKNQKNSYIPVPFKFDGYFQFPSPKENLFYNFIEDKRKLKMPSNKLNQIINNKNKIHNSLLKIYKHDKEDILSKNRQVDFLNIPLIINEIKGKTVKETNHLIRNIEDRIKFIKNPKNMCNGKYDYEKSSLSKALFDLNHNNSFKIYDKRLSETKYTKIKQTLTETINNFHKQTIPTFPSINNTDINKGNKTNIFTNRTNNSLNTFNTTFFNKTSTSMINDDISKCK